MVNNYSSVQSRSVVACLQHHFVNQLLLLPEKNRLVVKVHIHRSLHKLHLYNKQTSPSKVKITSSQHHTGHLLMLVLLPPLQWNCKNYNHFLVANIYPEPFFIIMQSHWITTAALKQHQGSHLLQLACLTYHLGKVRAEISGLYLTPAFALGWLCSLNQPRRWPWCWVLGARTGWSGTGGGERGTLMLEQKKSRRCC